MNISSDPANYFSDELMGEIFSHLGPKDLLMCRKVSSSWRRLSSDEDLWLQLWKKKFPAIALPEGSTTISSFINYTKRSVDSFEAVSERLRKFTSQLPWNEMGRFRCYFAQNPDCNYKAVFKHGLIGKPSVMTEVDFCIFTGALESSRVNSFETHTKTIGDTYYKNIEVSSNLPFGTDISYNWGPIVTDLHEEVPEELVVRRLGRDYPLLITRVTIVALLVFVTVALYGEITKYDGAENFDHRPGQ